MITYLDDIFAVNTKALSWFMLPVIDLIITNLHMEISYLGRLDDLSSVIMQKFPSSALVNLADLFGVEHRNEPKQLWKRHLVSSDGNDLGLFFGSFDHLLEYHH